MFGYFTDPQRKMELDSQLRLYRGDKLHAWCSRPCLAKHFVEQYYLNKASRFYPRFWNQSNLKEAIFNLKEAILKTDEYVVGGTRSNMIFSQAEWQYIFAQPEIFLEIRDSIIISLHIKTYCDMMSDEQKAALLDYAIREKLDAITGSLAVVEFYSLCTEPQKQALITHAVRRNDFLFIMTLNSTWDNYTQFNTDVFTAVQALTPAQKILRLAPPTPFLSMRSPLLSKFMSDSAYKETDFVPFMQMFFECIRNLSSEEKRIVFNYRYSNRLGLGQGTAFTAPHLHSDNTRVFKLMLKQLRDWRDADPPLLTAADYRAILDEPDDCEKTPIRIAFENGHRDLARLFEEYGATVPPEYVAALREAPQQAAPAPIQPAQPRPSHTQTVHDVHVVASLELMDLNAHFALSTAAVDVHFTAITAWKNTLPPTDLARLCLERYEQLQLLQNTADGRTAFTLKRVLVLVWLALHELHRDHDSELSELLDKFRARLAGMATEYQDQGFANPTCETGAVVQFISVLQEVGHPLASIPLISKSLIEYALKSIMADKIREAFQKLSLIGRVLFLKEPTMTNLHLTLEGEGLEVDDIVTCEMLKVDDIVAAIKQHIHFEEAMAALDSLATRYPHWPNNHMSSTHQEVAAYRSAIEQMGMPHNRGWIEQFVLHMEWLNPKPYLKEEMRAALPEFMSVSRTVRFAQKKWREIPLAERQQAFAQRQAEERQVFIREQRVRCTGT